jgi:hypothetical protein
MNISQSECPKHAKVIFKLVKLDNIKKEEKLTLDKEKQE